MDIHKNNNDKLIAKLTKYLHTPEANDADDHDDSNDATDTNNSVVDNANDANDANDSNSLDAKLRAGFCKSHLGKPAELETECSKLSRPTCMSTSCCNWAKMDSTESCVSGNNQGPIFNHNPDGSPKTLDYYYFENKCNGNCPTKK